MTTAQSKLLSREARWHERERAKEGVIRAFEEGRDWKQTALQNDVPYSTARRAILTEVKATKRRGSMRKTTVNMLVEVMARLEEYVDEDCRMTLATMCDRLHNDFACLDELCAPRATMHALQLQ